MEGLFIGFPLSGSGLELGMQGEITRRYSVRFGGLRSLNQSIKIRLRKTKKFPLLRDIAILYYYCYIHAQYVE